MFFRPCAAVKFIQHILQPIACDRASLGWHVGRSVSVLALWFSARLRGGRLRFRLGHWCSLLLKSERHLTATQKRFQRVLIGFKCATRCKFEIGINEQPLVTLLAY